MTNNSTITHDLIAENVDMILLDNQRMDLTILLSTPTLPPTQDQVDSIRGVRNMIDEMFNNWEDNRL